MTARYLRRIEAEIGDGELTVTVRDLLIRFHIRRESTATPAEGAVEIYNLNQSTETRIRQRGVRLQLRAGYEADELLPTLFDGTVRRVERERSNLDRITKISVGGTIQRSSAATVSLSYNGDVTLRTVIADAVESLDGVELGSVDAVPVDERYDGGFYYSGKTHFLLNVIAGALDGVRWYEESGYVHFVKSGQPQPTVTAGDVRTIGESTGMIGTPSITDDGIRVTTMLDTRLQLESIVEIRSAILQEGASGDAVDEREEETLGRWKIVALEHRGDNRGGPYETVFDARAVT